MINCRTFQSVHIYAQTLTAVMQYKVTPQKGAQQDTIQEQNRHESVKERKSQQVLQ